MECLGIVSFLRTNLLKYYSICYNGLFEFQHKKLFTVTKRVFNALCDLYKVITEHNCYVLSTSAKYLID